MNLLQNRKFQIALGVVLTIAGATAWFLWPKRGGAEIAKVREIGGQLMGEAGKNLPPEERRELAGQMREAMKNLSPGQRQELMKDRRAEMQKEMARFFTLPKEEQTAYLDKRIDDMEKMRAEFEKRRAEFEQANGDATKGPRQPRTPEQRDQRIKNMLASTTPEERAQRAKFMQQMRKRREERGLPELPFPRRGF